MLNRKLWWKPVLDQAASEKLVREVLKGIDAALASKDHNTALCAAVCVFLKQAGLTLSPLKAIEAVKRPEMIDPENEVHDLIVSIVKKNAKDDIVAQFDNMPATAVLPPDYPDQRKADLAAMAADTYMDQKVGNANKKVLLLGLVALLVVAVGLYFALRASMPSGSGVDQDKLLAGINANLDKKFDAAKTERATFEKEVNTKLDAQNTRIGEIDAKILTPEKLEAKIKDAIAAEQQQQDKTRAEETRKFIEGGGKLDKLSNKKAQAALASMLGKMKEDKEDDARLEAFADQCLQEVDKLRAERLKNQKPLTWYIDGKPLQ